LSGVEAAAKSVQTRLAKQRERDAGFAHAGQTNHIMPGIAPTARLSSIGFILCAARQ
jgi:hypothetical protein